jgi:two-component system NarL family response regulator
MAGRKRKIRVLVVDNNPCMLWGVQAYFKTKRHIKIIGQAREGAEAIQKAKRLSPDVVLMHLNVPNMDEAEALTRVRGETRGTKLIAYTMRKSQAFVREAIRAGATGYVLKSSSLAMLMHTVETIHGGRTFLDPNISASLPRSSNRHQVATKKMKSVGSGGQNLYRLTQREREILGSLVDGLLIKEISEQHHIRPHTVVSHLRNIYNKFEVHKRSAAVTKALREHIV